MDHLNATAFSQLVSASRPQAVAFVRGGSAYPALSGTVLFYPAADGTLVVAELFGLPYTASDEGGGEQLGPFYGFHVHEGNGCTPVDGPEAFSNAGGHWNPGNGPHPLHAGDMPALMGNRGYAYLSFFTEAFTPGQAIGKTVVVHKSADDYHTQPAGNAGARIGCGLITSVLR